MIAPPPLGVEKWNNFIDFFDFLQTLQKFISKYGLQLPVSILFRSNWPLKISFLAIIQSMLNIFLFSLLLLVSDYRPHKS
jgi:hypothetical protein